MKAPGKSDEPDRPSLVDPGHERLPRRRVDDQAGRLRRREADGQGCLVGPGLRLQLLERASSGQRRSGHRAADDDARHRQQPRTVEGHDAEPRQSATTGTAPALTAPPTQGAAETGRPSRRAEVRVATTNMRSTKQSDQITDRSTSAMTADTAASCTTARTAAAAPHRGPRGATSRPRCLRIPRARRRGASLRWARWTSRSQARILPYVARRLQRADALTDSSNRGPVC